MDACGCHAEGLWSTRPASWGQSSPTCGQLWGTFGQTGPQWASDLRATRSTECGGKVLRDRVHALGRIRVRPCPARRVRLWTQQIGPELRLKGTRPARPPEGGCDVEFEGYVAARGQALLRFAYVLTGDAQLAEDLTQTALAQTYRHWRRVSRLEHPDAYVRKAMLNAHLSWRRRRSSTERPTADVDPGQRRPTRRARSPTATRPAGCSTRCRREPARSSCCATTPTSTTPRSRRCSGSARAPYARPPPERSPRSGSPTTATARPTQIGEPR